MWNDFKTIFDSFLSCHSFRSTEVSLAEKQQKLFLGEDPDNEPEDADESESPLPNLMELVFFFEQAGIGLAREEMFRYRLNWVCS